MSVVVQMLALADTSRSVRSWANGYASGGRRPYVTFSCANLDEVEAAIRAFLAEHFPDVVMVRDEVHSTATYRKLDLDAHEHAPGLYGGPTQRRMLQHACQRLRGFLDECARASS